MASENADAVPDLIVARQSMLGECFIANLFAKFAHKEVFLCPPVTKPPEELIASAKGKHVLVLGGYFAGNIDELAKSCRKLDVFLNVGDDAKKYPSGVSVTVAKSEPGACQHFADTICPGPFSRMSRLLDTVLYGHPTDESLAFQNGMYLLEGKNDFEKAAQITSDDQVDQIIAAGEPKRKFNAEIAKRRVLESIHVTLCTGQKACVAIGDSPIVDTCIALAGNSPSGVGILCRPSLAKKRTFFTVYATKQSGVSAANVAKECFNGGGSIAIGGGSVDGVDDSPVKLLERGFAAKA